MFFPGIALAAYPLITDDTSTQGQGKYQLDLTAERDRDDSDGTRTETLNTAATLSYGIREDTDLVLGMPQQHVNTETGSNSVTESGRGDVTLNLKWRFFEKSDLSFALKPGITIPTGDEAEGLGTGKTGYDLHFLTSIGLESWGVNLDLGYTLNRNVTDERQNLWHISFDVWRNLSEEFLLGLDAGMDTNTDKTSGTYPAFVILGLNYSPRKNIDLDIGIKKGITAPEIDNTLLVGITLWF
jgi:Putative MetA-pathway of phenol degradation